MAIPNTTVLIGGAPGVGKTTLAGRVSTHSGIPALTYDDVHTAVRVYTSPQSQPDLHRIGRGGHTAYFTETAPTELVADAIAESNAAWPGFAALVRKHTSHGRGRIIDSWFLRPSLVAAHRHPGVVAVWIVIAPDVLWERERLNTDFIEASPEPGRMLDNFMQRSLRWQAIITSEASAADLPLLHQSGSVTVDTMTLQVIDLIDKLDR